MTDCSKCGKQLDPEKDPNPVFSKCPHCGASIIYVSEVVEATSLGTVTARESDCTDLAIDWFRLDDKGKWHCPEEKP